MNLLSIFVRQLGCGCTGTMSSRQTVLLYDCEVVNLMAIVFFNYLKQAREGLHIRLITNIFLPYNIARNFLINTLAFVLIDFACISLIPLLICSDRKYFSLVVMVLWSGATCPLSTPQPRVLIFVWGTGRCQFEQLFGTCMLCYDT